MSLFDGNPLKESETPDMGGRYDKPSKLQPLEITMEAGDAMCKHEWMWRGKANKFCIYCHRKMRVVKL